MSLIWMTPDDDIFNNITARRPANALVVPVNCVGAMGKGMAKLVAKQWPNCMMPYSRVCRDDKLAPGTLWMHHLDIRLLGIFFPTKIHWKNPSKLEYIESGLHRLAELSVDYGLPKEIRIPALGCGLGGLLWDDVVPLYHHYLGDLDHEFYCYPPRP